VREVNGRRMTAGALTWGLEPFGPSYAFTDYETARDLLKTASDETSYVLVGVERGHTVDEVERELVARIPGVKIVTSTELVSSIANFIIFEQSLGASFGASTAFGLIVGFVIVALSMFSSVVDNIREFGTLKAVGATTGDLALLLLAQSVAYALIGTLIGLALVAEMGIGLRSPRLTLMTPPWLTFGTVALMAIVCISASVLALLRIRKLEPAMVFR
jgi:putative ABC transport system permease protein